VADAYPKALESFLAEVSEPREQQSMTAAQAAVDGARSQLMRARAELQAFLEAAQTPDATLAIAQSSNRRNQLEAQLEQARVALGVVENRIVAAEDRLQRETRITLASPATNRSVATQRLIGEVADLQAQLAATSDVGVPLGGSAAELLARIEQRKRSLASEIEKLVTQTQKKVTRRPDSLEEQLRRDVVEGYVDRAALEAEITGKTLAIEQLEKDDRALPSQQLQEQFLRAEVQRLQDMLGLAATSYEEARTQLNLRPSQIVVVRQAHPAERPAFPLPLFDGVLAAVLGAVAGIYLVFAKESFGLIRAAQGTT